MYATLSIAADLPPLPAVPHRDSSHRKANTWPEALEKQEVLIRRELEIDPDAEYMRGEAVVVEDARDMYDRLVGPIDKQIAALKAARQSVLNGMAEMLQRRHPANPNLAEFLKRDDPASYLCW